MNAYAIKDPNGRIFSDYIGPFESDLKERMADNFFKSWEEYEKIGWCCVPVLITEIKTEKV